MDGAICRISLASLLEAAYGLHLANALPAPQGLYSHLMDRAGCLQPWLRLAIGEDGARALLHNGKAGWCMGALLGQTGYHNARSAVLAHDPAEMHALLAVDGLCRSATAAVWSALFALKGDMPRTVLEDLVPALVAEEWSDLRTQPTLGMIEPLLDGISARFGLSPRKEAADLSIWTSRQVDGTAGRTVPEQYYINGGIMQHRRCTIMLDDGTSEELSAGDPVRWPFVYSPESGERVRLDYHGASAGHPGYLSRVVSLDRAAEMSRLSVLLTEIHVSPDRSVSSEGIDIEVGQDVELTMECMEAGRGSVGRVTEIAGDMAIVDFGGPENRAVPCYGYALSILQPA